MPTARLLQAAGVAAAALVLWGLDRLSVRVINPPRRPLDPDEGRPHPPCRDVRIEGAAELHGWLLEPFDGDGAVHDRPGHPVSAPSPAPILLSHGWGTNRSTVLPFARALRAAGHPVLVYDYRGHGRSGPAPYITIRHYRDDTVAAARWLADRYPDRPLVLAGHSMGGAATVLAAAALEADEVGPDVAGLLLIAAPADILEVTAVYLRERGLPGKATVLLLRPFWAVRIGEPYRRLIPERRIGEVAAPLLLLEAEHDHRVSPDHGERLERAAGGRVERVRVPGTGHTDLLQAERSVSAAVRFLREHASGRMPAG